MSENPNLPFTEIIKQAVAVSGKIPDNAVIVPGDYKLENLERFASTPRFFKGKFKTNILSEFVVYVTKHSDVNTSVFVDNENIQATAIIDLGCHEAPLWGFHRADIILIKDPAYDALLGRNNQFMDQQGFIDFCEDWADNITFIFEDDTKMAFDRVIKLLRRVKVGFNKETTSEVQNSSSNRSMLESVDIKAGNEAMPIGFVFTTNPYDGISQINFQCQLRATSDEKNVRFKYRVGQLDAINQRISMEFRNAILSEFSESALDLSVHIGNMSY